MAGGGVKGFYRQKKKGGVAKAKPSPAAKKASKKKPHNCSQSQDCDGPHGDEVEEQLRLFDMGMTYGPCIGMTRLRRWERAAAPSPGPAPANPAASGSSSFAVFVVSGQDSQHQQQQQH